MLAWVVIDQTYPRQFLPKSSSLSTLCLCVEFSDSLRPTSVVPNTYALPLATVAPQPLCNQSVTHSRRGVHNSPMALPSRQRSSRIPIPCSVSPLFSIPCALFFALFCTPQKLNSFIFKRFRTLLQKNTITRGVGEGVRQLSASSCGFLGNSARPKWATFSRRHGTPVTSHSHQSLPLGALPFARGYRSARIRMETHDT